MGIIQQIALPVFLVITGLYLCGAALPRWLLVIGGIAGVISGVLEMFG
jgi:hypothetical protein